MSLRELSLVIPTSLKRRMMCPECGFIFHIWYARAIACQGCTKAAIGCKFVRCPKCDSVLSLKGAISHSSIKRLAKIHRDYYKQFGWSIRR